MSAPAFDELLRKLVDEGVGFVLVGGLALNAWGVVRGTKDVDVVAGPDPANLKRLAAAVVSIGGHAQQHEALLGSEISIAAALNAEKQVTFETDLGRLDVLRGLPGMAPYDELRARAGEADVLGVTVAVCSLEDLRAMKRGAGGKRDLADLEDLDAAHGDEPEADGG